MNVRPFREADAPALAAIFHAAVHGIGARYYSAEQVAAWSPREPDAERFRERCSDGRLVLVAVDEDDRPVAYIDLEADGHIDHLFCRPDLAGTGVAAMLHDRLEAEAAARGIRMLHVEASEPARRFFLRRGFSTVRRRDFEIQGVPIHNFAMEKRLT